MAWQKTEKAGPDRVNPWSIKNSYVFFPRSSGVSIATSLLRSTQDFLKLSFHMFP